MRPQPSSQGRPLSLEAAQERADGGITSQRSAALTQRLQRLRQHPGIASRIEAVRGGSQHCILAAVDALAERRTQQPQRRARALQVFARRMYRAVGELLRAQCPRCASHEMTRYATQRACDDVVRWQRAAVWVNRGRGLSPAGSARSQLRSNAGRPHCDRHGMRARREADQLERQT